MISMGKILFATDFSQEKGVFVLKLTGEVRVTQGPTIAKFLETFGENQAYQVVIIDLTESINLDSTTLGLLAKLAIKSKKVFDITPTIFSTNPDICRILDSMGFEQLFTLVYTDPESCPEVEELPTQIASEETMRNQVLDAHKILMSMNENNRACFCNLVDALEEEQKNCSAISDDGREKKDSIRKTG